MKTNFTATALVLAFGAIASTGFAAENGALTREQVRADYLQAQATGTLAPLNEQGMVPAKLTPSSLSREAVTVEYQKASKQGASYFVKNGPDFRLAPNGNMANVRPRVEVRLEAIASAKHHTQEFGG